MPFALKCMVYWFGFIQNSSAHCILQRDSDTAYQHQFKNLKDKCCIGHSFADVTRILSYYHM